MQVHQYIKDFIKENTGKASRKQHVVSIFGALTVLSASLGLGVVAPNMAHAAANCSNPYTVQSGDTLSQIADNHSANWQNVATTNGLANPNLIFVGQTLCLPATKVANATGNIQTVITPVQHKEVTPAPHKKVVPTPAPVAPAPAAPAPVAPAPVAPAPVAPTPTPVPQTAPAAPAAANSSDVSGMIDEIFGPYAGSAKQIAVCESGLNPNATNTISIGGSHAAGIFQILYPSTWNTTSQAGMSPYNARANIIAAHEIFVRDGYSWREWVCR
ncbi:LysM peptidoglycan-binding domain-containing protein [Dictyobacter vulcani]|uniref:LysM peptidoglycan-binding domain-containing protein n=1 Tax=Dictyobacter vulcani TaxID=2607529 RepID=UPI00124FEEC7|nr:LysM peptidoglycan-binding domain-containing protein [Dictyobacter vulcani]